MGRYRGIETAELRDKLISKGFGQGEGANYQPWIRVGDFPNHGESYRVWCDKTQRDHHYFSAPEYRHHLLGEFVKSVRDIREQFPIHPIEETLHLAEEHGILHPQFAGEPHSVTFDSLLTVDDGHRLFYVARSAKYCKDLVNPRVQEKLELERLAAIQRNYVWELVTEKELTRMLEKNLRWLRGWQKIERPKPDEQSCNDFVDAFTNEDLNLKLGVILDRTAKKLGISRQLSVHYFRYSAWMQMISVDLYSPLQLTKPHAALLSNIRCQAKTA